MCPFYSIIVPVYRVELFIARCIESVLSQTFNNFELILVDDGSPDKSGEICDDYASKDERIKVIHTKNGGVSQARNYGINNATGQWLIFLDADDTLFCADVLELICNEIRLEKADIYQFQIIVKEKEFLRKESIKSGFYVVNDDNYRNLKPKRGQVWNYVFSCNIIKDNNIIFPVGVRISEDQAFTYSYLTYCDTIKICDVLLYVYHINENPFNSGSIQDRNFLQDAMGHIKATKQIIYHLNSCNKNKSFINERIAMMILYFITLAIHLSREDRKNVYKYFLETIPFKRDYLFNNKWMFVIATYLNLNVAVFCLSLYNKIELALSRK